MRPLLFSVGFKFVLNIFDDSLAIRCNTFVCPETAEVTQDMDIINAGEPPLT